MVIAYSIIGIIIGVFTFFGALIHFDDDEFGTGLVQLIIAAWLITGGIIILASR